MYTLPPTSPSAVIGHWYYWSLQGPGTQEKAVLGRSVTMGYYAVPYHELKELIEMCTMCAVKEKIEHAFLRMRKTQFHLILILPFPLALFVSLAKS